MNRKKIILLCLCLIALLSVALLGFFYANDNVAQEEPDEYLPEEDEVLPYQHIFETYAPLVGWDWHLLAAVCYEESRFNPLAQSYQGAQGLMQLMPQTARQYALNDSTVWSPAENIRAGAEYISRLQQVYSFISDSTEQMHFVLASYNAGPAHIMDARRLAKRYGRSPYVWFDNTEYWLRQLQAEPYSTDSVVFYGAFPNSEETIMYVRKVLRTAQRFKAMGN